MDRDTYQRQAAVTASFKAKTAMLLSAGRRGAAFESAGYAILQPVDDARPITRKERDRDDPDDERHHQAHRVLEHGRHLAEDGRRHDAEQAGKRIVVHHEMIVGEDLLPL